PASSRSKRPVTSGSDTCMCNHLECNVLANASLPRRGSRRTHQMIVELEPDLDRSMSRRWATKADDVRVKRTMAALEGNGITALRAADLAEARRLILDLIPE